MYYRSEDRVVMNGYSQKEAKREGEGPLWIGAHQEFQWLETEGPLCVTSLARDGYCMGRNDCHGLVSVAMINTKTKNNLTFQLTVYLRSAVY